MEDTTPGWHWLYKVSMLVVYHVRAPRRGAKKVGEKRAHTVIVRIQCFAIVKPPSPPLNLYTANTYRFIRLEKVETCHDGERNV